MHWRNTVASTQGKKSKSSFCFSAAFGDKPPSLQRLVNPCTTLVLFFETAKHKM